MKPPRALLFDLDGTLLDTAPDMAAALNVLRAQEGMAPLPFEQIRPIVSHGNLRMIGLAFGEQHAVQGSALQQRFLNIYRTALATKTRLFDGLERILHHCTDHGIHWGVVTNKPGWLTEPLMHELQLREQAACVVSGDTVAERKPHPLPMLHAAQLLALAPRDCLYVGDAERDIQAGRAAGMRTLVALWGYLGIHDRPHEWQADGMLTQPDELLAWL